MARHVMIRSKDGVESVVQEAEILSEKRLHDVLTEHPELLPADDLDLGPTVVVGRESGLESGYADLVLVDTLGALCLVEVKKEGNPDTRRVIAQLLDYAAKLWQMPMEDFERVVLQPYLQTLGVVGDDLPDLASYVYDHVSTSGAAAQSSPPDEEILTDFMGRFSQTLTSGHFRLVVAAPSIPKGVEKVIEYLNSQGHLLYGLEISFFDGAAECFVPRLVVRPRVSEIRTATVKTQPVEEEDFLQSLPERVHDAAERFLHECEGRGGRITWNAFGASVRSSRSPQRVVAFLEKGGVGITVIPPKEYPTEPFTLARSRIAETGLAPVSDETWQHRVKYEAASDQQLETYFGIALQLLEELAPKIDFEPLATPITASFTRNDHNIWANALPDLAPLQGRWLRGTLSTTHGGDEAPVQLQPLAAGSPGWRPRFDSTAIESSIWPAGKLHGDYTLVVQEASRS
jgi:hypothetical protein